MYKRKAKTPQMTRIILLKCKIALWQYLRDKIQRLGVFFPFLFQEKKKACRKLKKTKEALAALRWECLPLSPGMPRLHFSTQGGDRTKAKTSCFLFSKPTIAFFLKIKTEMDSKEHGQKLKRPFPQAASTVPVYSSLLFKALLQYGLHSTAPLR